MSPLKFTICTLLVIIGFNIYFAKPMLEPEKIAVSEESEKHKMLVAWLECQKRGGTGYQYLRYEERAEEPRFYNLKSYEIVPGNITVFTVRVHSSKMNGESTHGQIRAWLTKDGKIFFVESNEDYLKRDAEKLVSLTDDPAMRVWCNTLVAEEAK